MEVSCKWKRGRGTTLGGRARHAPFTHDAVSLLPLLVRDAKRIEGMREMLQRTDDSYPALPAAVNAGGGGTKALFRVPLTAETDLSSPPGNRSFARGWSLEWRWGRTEPGTGGDNSIRALTRRRSRAKHVHASSSFVGSRPETG